MERLLIKNILSEEHIGKPLTVCGWVRTKRESKGFAFLVISDGSTQDTLQLVIPVEAPAFQELHRCTTGSAVRATGILRESPAKGQKF
ncbi:MAG: asparaginyl-tRNA synthetase, partial [Nitrospirae bacterium]|nr:asparaginyl-tRNA synthetase [Nitrospirota bacterium]